MWKLCVCVWKIVFDKVVCVCQRWCVTKLCVTKLCVCVTKMCVTKLRVPISARLAACHEKRRWMSPSAMLATQNQGQCRRVPRLPRETTVDVAKCHTCHAKVPRRHGAQACHQSQPSHKYRACHAKRRWMSPSATPATWNEGRCHQVLRLARKSAAAPRATKQTQARHQSQPSYPCHAKQR